MRHRIKKTTLGREKAPREMMLRNLVSSVLIYEKVTTTKAKAKAVKPLVEKAITTAKVGDLNARRALIAELPQKLAIKKAFEVLGKRYLERKGGYTRLTLLPKRMGDGAEMALIELI
jgi:large subunit ribosomal protein L17